MPHDASSNGSMPFHRPKPLYLRPGIDVETRKCRSKCRFANLQQTQLAGAGNRLGTPLYLQLIEDFSIMTLNRIQGEE